MAVDSMNTFFPSQTISCPQLPAKSRRISGDRWGRGLVWSGQFLSHATFQLCCLGRALFQMACHRCGSGETCPPLSRTGGGGEHPCHFLLKRAAASQQVTLDLAAKQQVLLSLVCILGATWNRLSWGSAEQALAEDTVSNLTFK